MYIDNEPDIVYDSTSSVTVSNNIILHNTPVIYGSNTLWISVNGSDDSSNNNCQDMSNALNWFESDKILSISGGSYEVSQSLKIDTSDACSSDTEQNYTVIGKGTDKTTLVVDSDYTFLYFKMSSSYNDIWFEILPNATNE